MTEQVDLSPPTAPRKVDGQGRELDQWGLPLNGPARIRALEKLGKPDPNVAPEAWTSAGTTAPSGVAVASGKTKVKTETENG